MWQISNVSIIFLNSALKIYKGLRSEKQVCIEEKASNMNCILNEKRKTKQQSEHCASDLKRE